MVKRKIVKIDEKKCNGCGICISNCPEGAIQIIDGKARLISDIFCDGLGACIGECPQGAIKTVEREAKPYDEKETMKENIIKAGENTIVAHLRHLKDHGETKYLAEAIAVLKQEGIKVDFEEENECGCNHHSHQACPGAKTMDFSHERKREVDEIGSRVSQLKQWPVQLHLVSPNASYFREKDVILVADCVGYSIGDFHKDYMKNTSIAIACPKLDSNVDVNIDKITNMIDIAKINTLTVMTMEVPCCNSLLGLAKKAAGNASRKIPIKSIVVGIKGDILREG